MIFTYLHEHTIELDCAPGTPRPDSYITEVVRGTALEGLPEADSQAAVSRLFGCWTWSFPNVAPEVWAEVQKVTKPRIEALFRSGRIRYGSW